MLKCKRLITAMLALCLLMINIPLASAVTVARAALVRSGETLDGMVRVCLATMGYPKTLDVTLYGKYLADGKKTDVEIASGSKVKVEMNTSTGNITMTYGGKQYDMGSSLRLRRRATDGDSGFKLAQAKKPSNLYPGDLQLEARKYNGGWRLYPIANVYIEYYLYGVVPYEMSNGNTLEALKAQAVAARTYTLNHMTGTSTLYDLVDTTANQVYYGNYDSATRAKQAVNETKGIVLMSGTRLAGTYYTSSNGGQTESIKNAWGNNNYSESIVKDDPFDIVNGKKVTATIYKDNQNAAQPSALRTLLNQKATAALGMSATVTSINGITLHTPKYAAPSRLYTKMDLNITAQAGGTQATLTVTCNVFSELESILGLSINSGENELWTVEEGSNTYTVTARRHGHGIGMSHSGAAQMGKLGYTYDQILGFYYDGTYLKQYTFSHTTLAANGNDTVVNTEKPADIIIDGSTTGVVILAGGTGTVNLRASASTEAAVHKTLSAGARVKILASEGDWYKVSHDGTEGYIMAKYLDIIQSSGSNAPAEPLPVIGTAQVTTPSGSLNLRAMASTDGLLIAQIPQHTKIPVHANQDGWTQVSYQGQSGWVMTKYLTMLSTETPPATEPDTPDQEPEQYARVTTASGSLNLRETKSGSARILATIPRNTTIPVLEKTKDWTRTTYAGKTGWVMNSFLTFIGNQEETPTNPPTEPPTETPPAGTVQAVVIGGGSLNLRASQSTSARILASIPEGTRLTILDKASAWSRTTYSGKTGWVMNKFLSFKVDGGETETQKPDTETNTPAPDQGGTDNTPTATYATVVGGKLNMRASKSTSSALIRQLAEYTRVEVLSKGTEWTKIKHNGDTGYVLTKYLSFGTSSGGTEETTANVKTPSGSLNLRADANGNARVILQIPQGSTVTVVKKLGSWCAVVYSGNSGFVMTKYLDMNASSSTTQPPATQGTATPTPTPTPTPPPKPTPDSTGNAAWVKTPSGKLNLRQSASSNAKVIAELQQGAEVKVLSRGTTWTQVSIATIKGYVMTQYLTWNEPAATDTPGKRMVVSTGSGSLNLRNNNSSNATVILTIPNKSAVYVLEKGAKWSEVSYCGVVGYVMNSFLAEK